MQSTEALPDFAVAVKSECSTLFLSDVSMNSPQSSCSYGPLPIISKLQPMYGMINPFIAIKKMYFGL